MDWTEYFKIFRLSTYSHFSFLLHLADNALILGQRNAEWTGHGPVLEQDIALTNISLDLIGQARNLYAHAAALYNEMDDAAKASVEHLLPRPWKVYDRELQEDDLAFLRDERQYLNLLITELPKGDWAFTILRQAFFSAYQKALYGQLLQGADVQLAGIAEKSLKEVAYHLRWSSEWVIRLGDGTAESNRRIHTALEELWPFTGELFTETDLEQDAAGAGVVIDMESIKVQWLQTISGVFDQAGLAIPEAAAVQQGGKEGKHTEQMGYLLAEMQYLQRAYPNATW